MALALAVAVSLALALGSFLGLGLSILIWSLSLRCTQRCLRLSCRSWLPRLRCFDGWLPTLISGELEFSDR